MPNCRARFVGPIPCPQSADGDHTCCRTERHETKTWLDYQYATAHSCRCGFRSGP